ncbi:muramoyltetrapeptide carboxypeptidase LdcA involved in peptidoglycan recycling [Rhizobium sp. PP-WC-1G-195]|nr:muramoyltetrapeptide carboxypeptidase LdcA involved in peptidoglycan recycling [Rhizobium sp. PP-WC-1G-195]
MAAVSPSWGGPSVFPDRYKAGKRQFEEIFGVEIVEMPNTLAPADYLAQHPEARANDLLQAFADPSIAGVVATIGGDDSIRLLPYLNLNVLRQNPKVFIGFSDTTAIHFACLTAGFRSFYGPSIMAGFAENGGMHKFSIEAVTRALSATSPMGIVPANNEGWVGGSTDWGNPALQTERRPLQKADTPRILQGREKVTGHLLGGCAEVLEMVKGSPWWPPLEAWKDAVLFYETSEDAPEPQYIRYWLRNLAAQGILQVLNGILIARPDPAGRAEYRENLEAAFMQSLAEAGLTDLPVVAGLDFGHTQPMLTLPYGALIEIDCSNARLTILDAGVF